MKFIQLKGKNLYIENVQANKLAKKYKTPFYIYSLAQLKYNFSIFQNAFKKVKPLICFSVKSNSN